ncbi:ABC transporter permease [Desulfobacula sp.]|uniref:ABC transporter permease n=1 Tax=Desulfobacula sp. TaxID=2593537 RepID=UPI001EBEA145|nr:FtsX-like permease family protein [Desulfobacula sp.]
MIFSEFKHRKKRTFGIIISFSIGIIFLILINSLADAFKKLAEVPMEKIGCNITVQRSGNVPEKMEGATFPCSAVTIEKAEIDKLTANIQINRMSIGVLIWLFDNDEFYSLLGIEPDKAIGPGLLKSCLTEGRFINSDGTEILVERTYAVKNDISINEKISLLGVDYNVAGIVDASKLGNIISANIYMPISQASIIAEESNSIKQIAPFEKGDGTILFMQVAQNQLAEIDKEIKNILGEKVIVSSPLSFLEKFKGIVKFFVKFSNILSFVMIFFGMLIITLGIMSGLNLRKHEFGIFQAVGWTPLELKKHIIIETLLYCWIGALLGIVISFLISLLLEAVTMDIPIPWELNSSTPHFLMDNPDEKIIMNIKLTVSISLSLIIYTLLGSSFAGIVIGLFTGRKISKIKPSEAIRYVG